MHNTLNTWLGIGTLRLTLTILASTVVAGQASAQNWSFDARNVALGSPGRGENLASKVIDEQAGGQSIVLPLGLIQVIRDFHKLNPTNSDFDLVRTLEYATGPVNYTFGRTDGSATQRFVADIRNADLRHDLNAYRGFVLPNHIHGEGLASPSWGHRFDFLEKPDGSRHGVYAGLGPYLALQSDLNIDPQLTDILGSETPQYVPNAQIGVSNDNLLQLAYAITGGYRGRFPLTIRGSSRNLVYVGANYNYLRGVRYEDFNIALRLDTDSTGMLTVNRSLPPPLEITRAFAPSGSGHAIDVGVATSFDQWEAGLSVNGIGNRIDWSNVIRSTYSLGNPLLGDFNLLESSPVSVGDVRAELPVNYRSHVSYNANDWFAIAEVSAGLGGRALHAGLERSLASVKLRGGATYAHEAWNPSGGVGFQVNRRIALDLAVYQTTSHVDRTRRAAVAMSLRLTR